MKLIILIAVTFVSLILHASLLDDLNNKETPVDITIDQSAGDIHIDSISIMGFLDFPNGQSNDFLQPINAKVFKNQLTIDLDQIQDITLTSGVKIRVQDLINYLGEEGPTGTHGGGK